MKLLLQRTIKSLGKAGDLVEVNSGYARNYLLPSGAALEPTPANLKRIEQIRAEARKAELAQLQELQAQAQAFEGLEVTISARANEQGHLFGSVGPADVSAALAQMGHDVPAAAIIIDPHIKQLDKYTIEIRLSEEAVAHIELWVVPETVPDGYDQEDQLQDRQDQPDDDAQVQTEADEQAD